METSQYIDMTVTHLVDLGRQYFYIRIDAQKRWIMTEYQKTIEGKPFERVYYNVNEKDPF